MKTLFKIIFFPAKLLLSWMMFPIAIVLGFFHSVLFKNNKF